MIKKLDAAIAHCKEKYTKTGNIGYLDAAEKLTKKKTMLENGTGEVIDVSIRCIMAYGGCVVFNYIADIKHKQRLLSRIWSGLRGLVHIIERYELQANICHGCVLKHHIECLNCFVNKDEAKAFLPTLQRVVEINKEG